MDVLCLVKTHSLPSPTCFISCTSTFLQLVEKKKVRLTSVEGLCSVWEFVSLVCWGFFNLFRIFVK